MAYLSFATRPFKMDLDNNIDTILQEAQTHNSQHNITGQLIYRAGTFVQFLEGEKEQVEKLLGRILLDHGRHENLKILLKQELIERVFPDWSMSYKKLDDAALDLVNSIVPWQQLVQSTSAGKTIPAEKILKIFSELKW